jgi:glycosyltransferase involved in cell wall biosynthesis
MHKIMNIILISHPAFLNSQSMPRFARMLENAYTTSGHQVTIWSPQAYFYKMFPASRLSKWVGYIDQYIIFPLWVRLQLNKQPANTLFVFSDQALGPWVPLVKNRPHVVHVHDLLALRSALGLVPENPTSWTGQIYQRYIRRGFQQAKNFISISNKTREDLHQFGKVTSVISEVVYNGLNYPYTPIATDEAKVALREAGLPVAENGMLLHLSGNQWYKNVLGVIRMYAHYARAHEQPLPLWLIGPKVDPLIQSALNEVPPQGQVLFFSGLDNHVLQAVYSLSRVFIFPSLAEGFGWPIIEAQACGCPVITTAEPPMNEIGGPAARYLPRLGLAHDAQVWASRGATLLNELLEMDKVARDDLAKSGIEWAGGFDAELAIESYLRIYQQVLTMHNNSDVKNN